MKHYLLKKLFFFPLLLQFPIKGFCSKHFCCIRIKFSLSLVLISTFLSAQTPNTFDTSDTLHVSAKIDLKEVKGDGEESDAVNSVVGADQIAGNSATRKVMEAFICPKYNISNVSVSAVCAEAGNTTVVLSSTQTSLPIGIYKVTYNLYNPVSKGLIAEMKVEAAGAGQFLISGLTTVGRRKIIITKLSSGECSSIIKKASAEIVISAAAVSGTVSSSDSSHICSGSNSPLLTLTNYNGNIVRWEYAQSVPYVWKTISNTANTYQPGLLAVSTSFRAVLKSGACSEKYSGETRIEVDSAPVAPIPVKIIQPTCATPTGTIILNGLTGSGKLLQNDGTVIVSRTFSGNSITISGLPLGTYKFAVENNCATNYSSDVVIQANTWNGAYWSYGTQPTLDHLVDFQASYYLDKDINACSCTISNDAFVTIQHEKTLKIINGLHVVSGSLTFADGASLIQTNPDNNLNTGDIKYKRKSQPIRQADYLYWSSPVKLQTLQNVSPLTETDKYFSYDGTKWISTPKTSIMTTGKGYIIRGPETFLNTERRAFAAVFEGVPNNGDITGETVEAGKFYLIGNPYPSALNANDFINENNFLEGTLYFWTHNIPVVLDGVNEYSSDDYAVYNLTGGSGVGTPENENNTIAPTGNIAAGQSFFVGATAPGTVKFNNLMRRGGNTNNQFFKIDKNSNSEEAEKSRIWVDMTNSEGAYKQLLIGYVAGATNEYDQKYDGPSFNGNKFLDFYSLNNGKNLAIQGRSFPFTVSDTVALGYRTAIAGDFTISINHADGTLVNHSVYLEDKLTNSIHDLRTSNYTFTTAIGTFDDRFILRYTNKSLGIVDNEEMKNAVLVSVKDKIIKVRSTKENITDVSIYDITGKSIYTKNKVNATELQINNLQAANQFLLVKTTLENGYLSNTKTIF